MNMCVCNSISENVTSTKLYLMTVDNHALFTKVKLLELLLFVKM